jgi:NPCBM/NEW2 domain
MFVLLGVISSLLCPGTPVSQQTNGAAGAVAAFPASLVPEGNGEGSALFELETAEGSLHKGPLVELREDGSLVLGGRPPLRVPGVEVIALRRLGSRLPPWPSNECVILTSQDVLAGSAAQLQGDQLVLRAELSNRPAEGEQDMLLNMPIISVIWLGAPADGEQTELLQRRLLTEQRRHDVLWLRNGDRLEGLFAGVDGKTVSFKTEQAKPTQIHRGRVAAIALSTELALRPRARSTYTHVVLANGSRISLATVRLEASDLVGKTLAGTNLRIPLAQLVVLEARGGRSMYLSDLKPGRFEEIPYFDTRWGYRNDASVAGRGLRLGGNHYDRGIGMHSAGRLTYELGGHYQRFESWVGLDERSGRQGNVTVQVLVDGKVQNLGWNGELDGRDPPKRVNVSVAGARELTLVVGFGLRGDVQDHVDWVEARLIRAEPK